MIYTIYDLSKKY